MIKAEVLHPSQLRPEGVRRWRAWCEADPRFGNPLLGPEFAQAVGAVRPDARVAVLSQDGAPAGYFAYNLRAGCLARPIGAPFSDYHAVISAPGRLLRGGAILSAANLAAFRYGALVDPDGAFEGVRAQDHGYMMRLGEGGAEAYLDGLRNADPKRFKNWRRLTNKLEREVGAVELVGPDHDQAAFDLLISWKRDQLVRSGLHDFMGPAWAGQLMQSLFERREGPMQGLMVTLRAGGRVVAGHFGVAANGHYHSWIASMDPDGGAWSPGQTLLFQAIAAMPRLGLHTYDLAKSHGHYKAPFCTTTQTVLEGTAVAATPAGRLQACAESAWSLAGKAAPAATRLRRRLDHITDIELSAAGRVKSLLEAVAAQRIRRRVADQDA